MHKSATNNIALVWSRLLIILFASVIAAEAAHGQQDNPVYVDDSPRAAELLHRARRQAADNVSEAVRLYQELLDTYGSKLIATDDVSPDCFVSVRSRALSDLAADDDLLQRYRLMQTARAWRRMRLSRPAFTLPYTGSRKRAATSICRAARQPVDGSCSVWPAITSALKIESV